MNTLGARELKTFVPAKDFALSQRFYVALGFEREWESPGLAGYRLGECRFMLQDYYVQVYAENFMMHLLVDDVDGWHAAVVSAAAAFGIEVSEAMDQPWGHRDFTFPDPSGVLWRIASSLLTE